MPTETSKIDIFKIDSNLFSGSSDTLRTAMNVFYYADVAKDSDNNIIGNRIFEQDTSASVEIAEGFNNVSAYELADNSVIKYTQINVDLIEESNTGPITRIKIPVRIIADDAQILNSAEWLRRVVGGTYGTSSYNQIFTEGTYDIFGHKYQTSYSELQKKYLKLYNLTETN